MIQMSINCPLNPLPTFIPRVHALLQEHRRYNICILISGSSLKGAPYNHHDRPPSLFVPLLPEVCQSGLRCCLLRGVPGGLAANGSSDYTIDRAGALPLGTRAFRQEKELDIKAAPISSRDLFKFVGGGDFALYCTQISTQTSCLCRQPHCCAVPV